MEVWWQTVVDEINQLLNDKDYQKAYDLTLKIIRGLDKDKIENWIAYKDILIYKHNDKKYIEKYLNPLKELLKIEFPALNEFIQQVDIINVALEELYFYIEKQLEDYRNEDYYYVLLTIINQYEIIAHKLNEALNKVTENNFLQVSLNYHFDLNNLINSLNSSLRRLLDEEKSFFNEDDIIDPDMYLTKLKEQYKYDFTIIMCKINSILDVYEALKDKIVIIESYNGDEFKLRYNHENFIKYNLPQIRKQEFDNEYFIKNSTEIPSEFQPLTANELTKLVELKKIIFY